MQKNNSKAVSAQTQNFLKLFRSQKASGSKTQNNKHSQIQQEKSQVPVQKDAEAWDLQLQSQSAMEAEELFGNLVSQSPVQQKKPEKPIIKSKSASKQVPKKVLDVSKQEQKFIQTKSILKKGRMTEERQEKDSQSESESQKQEKKISEEKRKTVTFQGILPVNAELQKKWNDPIENQRKGKFDKEQERILSEAVGKFLVSNDISMEQFEGLLTAGQRSDKISRKQKVFSLLSTVLPNRSPQSCYKYLKRNFNSLNRKGKWTEQEIDKLKILVQKYGRKWTLISKELKRTADNCYDKFRQLGEENMDERVKGIWKFAQLVELLKLIQKMTKIKFLERKVDQQLQKADFHDAAERQQVMNRKYNSKNFIFHNIAVLKPFVNAKNFQKIDISQIRWNQISTYLKTRNTLDCRNKTVQLLQIFFHSEPKQIDELIIDFFILNKYISQHDINWKDWKNKQITAQEAKNRYMIIKKMVEGRSVKPFKQIVYELKTRLQKRQKQKISQKQRKQRRDPQQMVEE